VTQWDEVAKAKYREVSAAQDRRIEELESQLNDRDKEIAGYKAENESITQNLINTNKQMLTDYDYIQKLKRELALAEQLLVALRENVRLKNDEIQHARPSY
jgi:chromosome segregation ATPase